MELENARGDVQFQDKAEREVPLYVGDDEGAPPVASEVSVLFGAIESLGSLVGEVERRLAPALNQVDDTAAGSLEIKMAKPTNIGRSALAATVREAHEQVVVRNNQLRSILERLEV